MLFPGPLSMLLLSSIEDLTLSFGVLNGDSGLELFFSSSNTSFLVPNKGISLI
jgi:hypothetical protein